MLAAAVVAGCGDDPPAARAADGAGVVVTDPTGREVRLDAPARRVVALIPSVNETIVALGAADRLIARTAYDDDPALAHLPSVGGGLDPSLEWLAAHRPDLVVAWPDSRSRALVDRLGALEIAVYAAPGQTLEDAYRITRDLGVLLGERAAADSLVAAMRAGLDSVRAATRDAPAPEVLYLIGLDPIMAAGPGTFVDQLLRVAGARNALVDLDAQWPTLSLEDVVRRDPQVVVLAVGGADADPVERVRSRPGWRDLAAVRAGRVHAVEPDRFNRWGPDVVAAARRLAQLLHP